MPELKYMEHIACGEVFEQPSKVQDKVDVKREHLRRCDDAINGKGFRYNLTEAEAF